MSWVSLTNPGPIVLFLELEECGEDGGLVGDTRTCRWEEAGVGGKEE